MNYMASFYTGDGFAPEIATALTDPAIRRLFGCQPYPFRARPDPFSPDADKAVPTQTEVNPRLFIYKVCLLVGLSDFH